MIFRVTFDSGHEWLFAASELPVLGWAKRLWQSGAVSSIHVEDSKGIRLFYAGDTKNARI